MFSDDEVESPRKDADQEGQPDRRRPADGENKPASPRRRRRVARQIRAVAAAMAAIAASVATSPTEVLTRIAKAAQELTGARYCALGIGTDPREQFHPWIFVGMSEEEARAVGRTPRPVCLLGAVPQTNETIRLAEMQRDPRHCGFPPHHPHMRRFLGVPVRLGERSMGNLYLTDKADGTEFTDEDQAIVEALAAHAAVAVDNARLYELARQRTAELEEERQQRETFVSVVAHELRGPLTVLMGYSDLLPQWEQIPPARREPALRAMGEQSRQMSRLVSDLLDVSRIQTGRFSVQKATVDVAEIVRNVVAAQQATAPDREIRVQTPPSVMLEVDGDRVAQALTNLVSNAIKYSPEGSPVSVQLVETPGEVLISVADRGYGFTAEQMDSLFKPYSRLTREQQTQKGVGLGLFISKGIVEAHGGRIWAESPGPDMGATFHIVLPKQPAGQP